MQVNMNGVGTGYTPIRGGNTGAGEVTPKDTVTLNLRPEQLGDKNIQAFLRQMAMEGTPIALNLDTGSNNGSPTTDKAAGFAQSAQISASQAQASAERANLIEQRISQKSTTSAPPTYSEG
jgi:hypothetical protein